MPKKEMTINLEHNKKKIGSIGSIGWFSILQKLKAEKGVVDATRKTDRSKEKTKISVTVELNDKSTLTEEEAWVLIQGLAGNTKLTRIS